MENSTKFMKNSGLTASKSLELNPTQGSFNTWCDDQSVIAQMLESVLFGPTLLTEKVQVHSDNVANLVFPVLNFSLVYSVLLVFCPTPVSIVS